MTIRPKMAEVFPVLSQEIADLLIRDEHEELAGQIPNLAIEQCCTCGDEFCTSFYTVPPPKGSWGPGHRNIVLGAEEGMLVLDVVDDAIVYVEVLDRPEVRPAFENLKGRSGG